MNKIFYLICPFRLPKLTLIKLLKGAFFSSCGRLPMRGNANGPGGNLWLFFPLNHSSAKISPARISVTERSMLLCKLCLLRLMNGCQILYVHSVFGALIRVTLCLYLTGFWTNTARRQQERSCLPSCTLTWLLITMASPNPQPGVGLEVLHAASYICMLVCYLNIYLYIC